MLKADTIDENKRNYTNGPRNKGIWFGVGFFFCTDRNLWFHFNRES